VVCLPLHHPVRVYEDLAMLDVLSHGRLELGLGKGITKFEHLQFGHDPEEAGGTRQGDLRHAAARRGRPASSPARTRPSTTSWR
jgi:alkanesulfonate monooxygenase SsuD/methylene tetrahydromethanopterin reductase-like flavin-dependent oxidoreductase (luciferase family)